MSYKSLGVLKNWSMVWKHINLYVKIEGVTIWGAREIKCPENSHLLSASLFTDFYKTPKNLRM